jgi:hypothetical protein
MFQLGTFVKTQNTDPELQLTDHAT